MKKIVITLDDGKDTHECQLRIPKVIAGKVRFTELSAVLKDLFHESGLEVIHIEECEEMRHQMQRRWDDEDNPKTVVGLAY